MCMPKKRANTFNEFHANNPRLSGSQARDPNKKANVGLYLKDPNAHSNAKRTIFPLQEMEE